MIGSGVGECGKTLIVIHNVIEALRPYPNRDGILLADCPTSTALFPELSISLAPFLATESEMA